MMLPRRSSQRLLEATLAATLMLLAPAAVRAHATGENYVWLNVEADRLSGRFEIRVDDLERRFGNSDDVAAVHAYLADHFAIEADGAAVPYAFTAVERVTAGELEFAQFFYETAPFEVPDRLEVENRVLLDLDRTHRSLLCIEYDRRRDVEYGEEFTALVFSRINPRQTLDLTDVQGILRVRDFVWQGVLHIWVGIDHVLFLLALLLTAVVERRPEPLAGESGWRPVADFRTALWNVVKIVTLFTVAHSITLSLAALDFVRLPGRLVESVIALSILLVAVNNVVPKVRERHWLVILVFGLFHGLGFASVMGELPFRMGNMVQVVLAFNVGVELGQVAIVAVGFPLLFAARKSAAYRPAILIGGSMAIGVIAGWWFVTRALGVA